MLRGMPMERRGIGTRNVSMFEARDSGVDDGGRGDTGSDKGVVREEADGEVFGVFSLRVAASVVRAVGGGGGRRTVSVGKGQRMSVRRRVGEDVCRIEGKIRRRGDAGGGGDEDARWE